MTLLCLLDEDDQLISGRATPQGRLLTEVAFGATAMDGFSRLRTSMSHTLFDAQQEYGLDTLRIWDASANGTLSSGSPSTNGSVTDGAGNSVGPTNASTRITPLTVSATPGHYSILQGRQYTRYIPGFAHMALLSGVYAPAAGCALSIVLRSSTSGAPVDTVVPQAEWNLDPFDGTGPSGVTLDCTKTQILWISAQWLGVGRVVVGFDVGGQLYPAHALDHANILSLPYTQTFNLPARYEVRNTGVAVGRVGYFDAANGVFLQATAPSAGAGTIALVCCSVQSEGGFEQRGFPFSVSSGAASVAVTTRRPVISIRPKATYNGRTNRAHIELAEFLAIAATNSALIEVVLGGTLTGAVWAGVSTASIAEVDTTASAITGGTTLYSDYALPGSGSVRGRTSGEVDIRSPIVLSLIDAAAALQIPLTLVATSLSGTANVSAALHWHEQTV